MNVRTTAEERAYAALDIIDRFRPGSNDPRVTAAYTVLAAAMDQIYGELPVLSPAENDGWRDIVDRPRRGSRD